MGGLSLISLEILFLTVLSWLVVFAQCEFDGLRSLIGAQFDLLPSILVYAGLSGGLWTVLAVSFGAGLALDSLSQNPWGVSVFPLFLVGWLVHSHQDLILRTERYAQFLLGLGASALAPLITLSIIIFVMGDRVERPVIGWGSVWHWAVSALSGGVATPLIFLLGDLARRTFLYQPAPENRYSGDREIKRWRI